MLRRNASDYRAFFRPGCSIAIGCYAAAHETLLRLFTWGPTTDPSAARARFLAWPLAGGVWLRSRDAATHARAVSALRARARDAGSTVALVATRRDVDVEKHDWARTVRERWARWRVLSKIVKKEHLDDSSADTAPTLPLGWTDLDVLVVPRVSSLASPRAFVAEVRALAPTARVLGSPDVDQ